MWIRKHVLCATLQTSTLTEQLKQVKAERDDLLCEKEASCWNSSQEMEELHYRLTSLSKEKEELQESLEVMRQEKQQFQSELEERVETLQTEVGTSVLLQLLSTNQDFYTDEFMFTSPMLSLFYKKPIISDSVQKCSFKLLW